MKMSSSAQGKMRTNGMFLRSFDSKRYQELQAQKQKILEKQKELMKIKEKRDAKRKAQEGKKGSDGENVSDTSVDTQRVINTDGSGGIKQDSNDVVDKDDSTLEEVTSEDTGKSEDEMKVDIQNKNSTLQLVGNTGKMQSKDIVKGSSDCTERGPNQLLNDTSKYNANQEQLDVGNTAQGTAGIKKSLSGQNVKEYAIIAKQNQQAIRRETALLEQKSGPGVYAKTDNSVNKPDKQNIKPVKSTKVPKQCKANSDAYAVVDLTVTMNLVNEINGNTVEDTTEKVANQSDGKSDSKARSSSKGLGYVDYKDIISNYKYYNKMSRSAGYSGDIDTSTSSLEPDYVDYAQMDQYLSSKLALNKDRLVITEEQLNSLQTITSSSSG